ncbi:unnamed protein product, partial [Laminaria digitata]
MEPRHANTGVSRPLGPMPGGRLGAPHGMGGGPLQSRPGGGAAGA